MWDYQKTLQYPIRITNPNPLYAKIISSQYGGPDGELGASLRYLSQRFSMPTKELQGLLTDIGTEELGHLEMVGTIIHQLTRNLSAQEIKQSGFESYFVDHTNAVYPAPVCRLRQPICKARATRLRTCLKTWPPNRKREPPMTTFCVWWTTRMCAT